MVGDEGDVRQPLGHIVVGLLGVIVVEGKGPPRGQEFPKYWREQIGHQAAHRGHPQSLRPVPIRHLPGLQPKQPPLLRHPDKIPAPVGELHPALAPAPDHQGTAQCLLQRPQVPAHRRLGDVKRLGCGGDTAQAGHCEKNVNPLLGRKTASHTASR